MKNKLVSVVAATALTFSMIPVFAGSTDTNVTTTEERRYEIITTDGEIRYETLGETGQTLSAADDTDVSSAAASFYDSSPDHGRAYEYYKETYGEGSVYLSFYDDLLAACKSFTTNYSDVPDTVVYFGNGQYKLFKELPGMVGHGYTGVDSNELIAAYFMFRNDHPEYYWLSNETTTLIGSSSAGPYCMLVAEIYDEYIVGAERKLIDERMDSTVKKYLSYVQDDYSTYTKVRLIHDMIGENVKYGYQSDGSTPLDTPYAHSIVGVFDGDTSTDVVCEGYAKSFQLLLGKLGIDNVYVTGIGMHASGSSEDHAWNIAKLADDNYYNFDLTWDDTSGQSLQYSYFAKGSATFGKTHKASDPSGVRPQMDGSTETTGSSDIDPQYFLYTLPTVSETDYDGNSDEKVFAPDAFDDEGAIPEATAVPTPTPNEFEDDTAVKASRLLCDIPDMVALSNIGELYSLGSTVTNSDGTEATYNTDYAVFYKGERLTTPEYICAQTGWLNGEEIDFSQLEFKGETGVTVKSVPQYYATFDNSYGLYGISYLGRSFTFGVSTVPQYTGEISLSSLISPDAKPDDIYDELYGLTLQWSETDLSVEDVNPQDEPSLIVAGEPMAITADATDTDVSAMADTEPTATPSVRYDEHYVYTYKGKEIPSYYAGVCLHSQSIRKYITGDGSDVSDGDEFADLKVKTVDNIEVAADTIYAGYDNNGDHVGKTYSGHTVTKKFPQDDETLFTPAPTPVVTDAPTPTATADPVVTDAPAPTETASPEPSGDDYPYLLSSPALQDGDGNPVTSLEKNTEYTVTVTYTEQTSRDTEDYVFVAAYAEDGTLVSIGYKKADLSSGGDTSLTIKTGDKTVEKVKAYIWDDFADNEPLAKAAETIFENP